MNLRAQMENLIEKMLDGRILLTEALTEFEKVYIQKALERNGEHLSQTAEVLGIHRNTLSKKVSAYQNNGAGKPPKRLLAKRSR
jgi:DNA-binding NtrC family response regulator